MIKHKVLTGIVLLLITGSGFAETYSYVSCEMRFTQQDIRDTVYNYIVAKATSAIDGAEITRQDYAVSASTPTAAYVLRVIELRYNITDAAAENLKDWLQTNAEGNKSKVISGKVTFHTCHINDGQSCIEGIIWQK